ncbi:MAG: hypothetical protein H7Y06_13505 [Opitutaceae bacterium]|nr:hypothetical protein [Opitutaceae bacterium]
MSGRVAGLTFHCPPFTSLRNPFHPMHTFFRSAFFLTASVAALALHASPLVDETFENPTEATYRYPSATGEIPNYHGNFSGWAGGGVIAVTYGRGLGFNASSGMLCKVEQPASKFMQLTLQKVMLPFSDPSYVTRDQLKAYQLEFDAKIPEGKVLTVYLGPQGPKEMVPLEWASRLIFGKAVGTGAYKRYVFPASAATDQSLNSFLQFCRDAYLNGTEKTEVNITWLFSIKEQAWAAGESMQIDNVKLVTGP